MEREIEREGEGEGERERERERERDGREDKGCGYALGGGNIPAWHLPIFIKRCIPTKRRARNLAQF